MKPIFEFSPNFKKLLVMHPPNQYDYNQVSFWLFQILGIVCNECACAHMLSLGPTRICLKHHGSQV